MYDKFLNIDKEKQQRIINACLEEFSKKGYTLASTNNIVKSARISKGLLFHYFKNKKGLFLYLFNHMIDMIVDEIYNAIDLKQTDLFTRLQVATEEKFKIIYKYPTAFAFIEKVMLENAPEVSEEIVNKRKELFQGTDKLFQNIDYTKFKDGIEINKVIPVIMWSFEGLGNRIQEEAKQSKKAVDYEKAYIEVESYIKFFKQLFYKEEEL